MTMAWDLSLPDLLHLPVDLLFPRHKRCSKRYSVRGRQRDSREKHGRHRKAPASVCRGQAGTGRGCNVWGLRTTSH